MKESLLITTNQGLFLFEPYTSNLTQIDTTPCFGIAIDYSNSNIYVSSRQKESSTLAPCMVYDKHLNRLHNSSYSGWMVDESTHYMQIYDSKLIAQETYAQRMRIYNIDNSKENTTIIPLFEPAVNYHYEKLEEFKHYTTKNYRHMNAFIRLPDDRYIVSCAYLGREYLQSYENKQFSTLEVFDKHWNHLQTIQTKYNVIHDLVICNNKIWLGGDLYLVCIDINTFHEIGSFLLPITKKYEIRLNLYSIRGIIQLRNHIYCGYYGKLYIFDTNLLEFLPYHYPLFKWNLREKYVNREDTNHLNIFMIIKSYCNDDIQKIKRNFIPICYNDINEYCIYDTSIIPRYVENTMFISSIVPEKFIVNKDIDSISHLVISNTKNEKIINKHIIRLEQESKYMLHGYNKCNIIYIIPLCIEKKYIIKLYYDNEKYEYLLSGFSYSPLHKKSYLYVEETCEICMIYTEVDKYNRIGHWINSV